MLSMWKDEHCARLSIAGQRTLLDGQARIANARRSELKDKTEESRDREKEKYKHSHSKHYNSFNLDMNLLRHGGEES